MRNASWMRGVVAIIRAVLRRGLAGKAGHILGQRPRSWRRSVGVVALAEDVGGVHGLEEEGLEALGRDSRSGMVDAWRTGRDSRSGFVGLTSAEKGSCSTTRAAEATALTVAEVSRRATESVRADGSRFSSKRL